MAQFLFLWLLWLKYLRDKVENLVFRDRFDIVLKMRLRAYPNNPLYCIRLQSQMPALSAKTVLNVEKTTSGEHFWRVRLGLELFARPHNDPVIRISS